MAREKKADKFVRALAVAERMNSHYGEAACALHYTTPFTLTIAVLLSAQTTDAGVNRVTPELFAKYGTPQAMAQADPEDIARIIRSIGFYRTKAKNCIACAQMIMSDFGGEVPRDMDQMQKLPGVGRKTANVMLAVVWNRAAMAVDTHVFRVSERIGLTTNSRTPLATEKALVKHIPEELIPMAHHWLILHGRYTCKARRPDCLNCPLTQVCRHYSRSAKEPSTL